MRKAPEAERGAGGSGKAAPVLPARSGGKTWRARPRRSPRAGRPAPRTTGRDAPGRPWRPARQGQAGPSAEDGPRLVRGRLRCDGRAAGGARHIAERVARQADCRRAIPEIRDKERLSRHRVPRDAQTEQGVEAVRAAAICGSEIADAAASDLHDAQSHALRDKRTPAGPRICRFAAKRSGGTRPAIARCRRRCPPGIPDTRDGYHICPSRSWGGWATPGASRSPRTTTASRRAGRLGECRGRSQICNGAHHAAFLCGKFKRHTP